MTYFEVFRKFSKGMALRWIAMVISLLVVGVGATDPGPQRVNQLANLLVHDCGSCHGTLMKGGLGPPLTANALQARSLEWIEYMILNGRQGTAMPPWRDLLQPGDAEWLARTLKSGQVQGDHSL